MEHLQVELQAHPRSLPLADFASSGKRHPRQARLPPATVSTTYICAADPAYRSELRDQFPAAYYSLLRIALLPPDPSRSGHHRLQPARHSVVLTCSILLRKQPRSGHSKCQLRLRRDIPCKIRLHLHVFIDRLKRTNRRACKLHALR